VRGFEYEARRLGNDERERERERGGGGSEGRRERGRRQGVRMAIRENRETRELNCFSVV